MKSEKIKEGIDIAINRENAGKKAIDFVNSLNVDGKIDICSSVYALAFYAGVEYAEAQKETL